MPTLNPWIILGFVLAMGAAIAGSYIKGHSDGVDTESARWTVAIAKQETEAQVKLDAANAATRAREQVIAALKDKVENDYVSGKAQVDAAYSAGVRSGSVFVDRAATCRPSGDRGVPADPAAAGRADAGATGCELSAATTAALRELAHDADNAALMAGAGHDYGVGLQKIFNPPGTRRTP